MPPIGKRLSIGTCRRRDVRVCAAAAAGTVFAKKVITPTSGSAQTIYYETNNDNTVDTSSVGRAPDF